MVTHIPSPSSSNVSLPISPSSTSTYGTIYASSQAASSTLSFNHRAFSSSSAYREKPQNSSRRGNSLSSYSSQATLVPTQNAPTGYPPPRSVASLHHAAPSAYRAPSVASTSALRPAQDTHRRRTSSSSSRRSSNERDSSVERNVVQNTFPWFGQTGDVEICVRDRSRKVQKKYLLHRLILTQNAGWFEKGAHTADGSRRRSNIIGGIIGLSLSYNSDTVPSHKEYYELEWTRFLDENKRIPLLIQKPPPDHAFSPRPPPPSSTTNKPHPPSSSFLRSFSSASGQSISQAILPGEESEILTAYDNLFLSFYNHAPALSTSNIAEAYVDSKLLLLLASAYSAIATVGPRIDHHLLRFGSRLWKQIAKYPPSYLKLGYLARSKAIFAEALIHVVGRWPAGQSQLQRGMPGVDDLVVDLIEDKFDELEGMKTRVEAKLFRLSLTTGRGERVSPSNSYVEWLALSLFRQWTADGMASVQTGILKDGSGDGSKNRSPPSTSPRLVRTYRIMAAGGQGYLTHDECKRFLKLRPGEYSRENLRKFERAIDQLKNLAAEAVKGLMRNCLELEVSGDERMMDSLTCVRCEERDFEYIWN